MNMSHLVKIADRKERGPRTVDSDGDALAEDKAISALKGGDLAELVEPEVLLRDTVGGNGLDKLKVEVVLLCYDPEASSAGVALYEECYYLSHRGVAAPSSIQVAYRIAVELAERHVCECEWEKKKGYMLHTQGKGGGGVEEEKVVESWAALSGSR